MTSLLKITVTALASLLLFSCGFDCISGQGEVTTKEHPLEDFDQISVMEGWDAVLVKGNENKLVVTANENLHGLLEFSIQENALEIGLNKNCIMDADANTVEIHYTSDLQRVAASSGAEVTSQETLKQDKIAVDASSGADIELRLEAGSASAEASSGANIELGGTTGNFTARASSGSEIEAKNLESQTATADASSGSEISLTAKKSFTGEASSGGDVDYYGNPESINVNDSSGGNVNKH